MLKDVKQEVYISDNHAHINVIKGLGAREIACRFRREGGRLLIIASLLTWSHDYPPCELSSFEKLYRDTVTAVRLVREEGVNAGCVLGIHPAEIEQMISRGWSREQILSFVEKCLNMITEYIKRGEAQGIGEVGRPHWEVPERNWSIHNEVLELALGYARDLDVPVHLHLERKGEHTLQDIVNMVRKVNNRPYRVVLHHAQPEIAVKASELGLTPSIPVGRRDEFAKALELPPVYVVESDYLDDPRRPGAVIAPWALARKMREVVSIRGVDYVNTVCLHNVKRCYGDLLTY